MRKYGYQYDNLNRLTNAIYQKPNHAIPVTNSYNESLQYDKNGNITNLQRTGDLDNDSFTIEIDNLNYNYDTNSNLLKAVQDISGNPTGFKDVVNTQDFYYDANGNMYKDANKNITSITYNHLNLPTKIVFTGTTKNIVYLYDATGQKVKKVVTNGTTITTTDYLTGYQYENAVLKFFPTAEGYVNNTVVNGINNYNYVYNYTDHLGNIRLSYSKDPVTQQLKILSENNYYPFGMKHEKYNVQEYTYQQITDKFGNILNGYYIGATNVVNTGIYKYKYNGKEYQDELGLNMTAMDYRQYDNAIGRFNSIDALSEIAPNWTPYRFAFNNPVLFCDPSGLWEKKKDGSWYTNDKKDIERFMDMLSIEESQNGGASMAQVDTFIGEEFTGSGGRLSDGSALLDGITTTFKGGKMKDLSPRQISRIQSQMDAFTSNPWNEKSLSFSNPFYTYKYFRERSWSKRGGGFPGLMIGEFALAQVNKRLFNANNWYSLSQMKSYGHNFHGNQFTESRMTIKNLHRFLELAGKGMAVYSLYGTSQEYMNGTLTGYGASYIGAIDGSALASKNPYIAAMSLGTGLGKSIVESDWYYNAVHDAPNW